MKSQTRATGAMRVKAIAKRILSQMLHDKRTLALIFLAPLLLLTVIFFILNSDQQPAKVALVNAPLWYHEALYENEMQVLLYDESEGMEALKSKEIVAVVSLIDNKLQIKLDGSDKTKAAQAVSLLEKSKASANTKGLTVAQRPDLSSEIQYIYGSSDLEMFDNYGSAMIGILVFFFVFLISGISFLQERNSGTLERLLSTPVRRWEIVFGYILGFGIIAAVQSSIVALFAIYVLDIMIVGSLWLVLILAVLSAMTALTLGLLASTAASNEFQMIQFIPLVLIPQIFFSGMFALSGIWEYVGYLMPLYYVSDGLSEVMLRGGGFKDVMLNIGMLVGFCAFFMIANTKLLKKHRRI